MEYFYTICIRMVFCFIIMGLGYFCFKIKIFSEEGRISLGKFISKIVLPLMCFSVIINSGTRAEVFDSSIVLLLAAASFALQFSVALLSSKILKLKGYTKGVHIAISTMSNNGFLGIPLFAALFGENKFGMLTLSIFFIVDQLYVWTIGYYNLSGGKAGGKLSIKKVFTPAFILIFSGLIIVLSGFDVHAYKPVSFIFETASEIGALSKVLALIYIGACIPQLSFKRVVTNKNLITALSVKMLAIPVVIILIFKFIPIEFNPEQIMVIIITSGIPSMISLPALAYNENSDYDYALQGTLVSNVVCLVTLPLITAMTQLV